MSRGIIKGIIPDEEMLSKSDDTPNRLCFVLNQKRVTCPVLLAIVELQEM